MGATGSRSPPHHQERQITMFAPTNWLAPWAQLSQVQLDQTLRMTVIGLDGVEKLLSLQVRLWKDLCTDATQTFAALRSSDEEQGLSALKDQAQPALEHVATAYRAIFETVAAMQAELARSAEQAVEASLASLPTDISTKPVRTGTKPIRTA